MELHPLLSDLVEKTLQEIGKLGLCTELNRQYRRMYERLKAFAKERNEECCSPELLRCFLADTDQRYRERGHRPFETEPSSASNLCY